MICKRCGKTLPDDSLFCQYCGAHFEDLTEEAELVVEAAEPEAEPQPEAPVEPKQPAGKATFCKQCGGLVDPETKKCTNCGKQYFKFPARAFVRGLVAALIIAMGVGLVYLYNQNQDLQDELASRTKTADNYKQQLDNARENYYKMILDYNDIKANYDFYKVNAAIVVNGDDCYHSYDCSILPTFWNWGSYRILDKRNAQEDGYAPCPFCQ